MISENIITPSMYCNSQNKQTLENIKLVEYACMNYLDSKPSCVSLFKDELPSKLMVSFSQYPNLRVINGNFSMKSLMADSKRMEQNKFDECAINVRNLT